MKEIKSLSFEDNKKYQAAIQRGYFDSYDEDPRAWRRSFLGTFVWKYPKRIPTIDIFTEVVGHVPTWADVTDQNLRYLQESMAARYCANTCKNRFAELKAIINEYADEQPMNTQKFKRILVAKGEPSQAVYLNTEEVSRIIAYTPRSEYERYVRKIFLIEALTGARNCDSVRLSLENVDFERQPPLITYFSQKVRKNVSVPMHTSLHKVLAEKIEMNAASPAGLAVSLDTFNSTLRTICQRCGCNERVTIFRRGQETTAEKWQFVSSHTGRRSFATNLFMQGVDPYEISEYMGHSSPQITIQRYIIGHKNTSDAAIRFFNTEL